MDEMGSWLRPAATVLAAAGIVLVLVNAGLVLRNQSVQAVVSQRQQVINQAAMLARASQAVIQALAVTAIKNKDDAILALLERHGIHVNPPSAETEKKP
jgi:hypothetical protein